MTSNRLAHRWLLLLAFAPLPAGAQTGATYTPIALSGSTAPGISTTTFNMFTTPSLNAGGSVVFSGTVAGATSTSDSATWIGTADALTLVVRESDAAPGLGANVFFGDLINSNPTFSSVGQVAFFNILQGSAVVSGNSQSLWLGGSSTPSLVARAGNTAPGTSANFVGFGAPDPLNNSGEVAFHGFLTTSQDGIWAGATSGIEHIASSGSSAPGAGSGATFYSFGNAPVMNASGDIAFTARISPPALFDTLPQGVWHGTSAGISAVAAKGNIAAGAGGVATFNSFSEPKINSSGSVAFNAILSDNSRGIWVTTSSGLTLVARTGQAAPGTSDTFINVDAPIIGAGGHVAFGGRLSNFDTGMWAGSVNAITLLARTGNAAPGGGTFGTIGANAINAHGQVAFFSTVNSGPGASALFAIDPFGQLVRIVGAGDMIPVSETESRLVSSFAFTSGSGGSDGRPIGLNDDGQLAFRANFSDLSSAVVVGRVGGAARFTLDPPILGPSAVSAGADLIVVPDGNGGYTPALADVSDNAGYIRFSGLPVGQPVHVYLNIVGGTPAVEAVRRELLTGATTYGYAVTPANEAGALAAFNLLVRYIMPSNGGTQTFSWNFRNISGAQLDSLAIVPEPAAFSAVWVAVAMLRRRRISR